MFNYFLFGLTVESEFEIVGMPQFESSSGESSSPDVVIRHADVSWELSKTTLTEEFVAYGPVGEFRIRGGSEVTVRLRPDAPEGVLSVLLAGRIMAYLLRQRGWLPLHASAVRIGDSAILFMGRVGAGKSTTAAAFHRRGHPVLTDDVAPVMVVGEATVLQVGPPQLRLCEDAAIRFQQLDPGARWLYDKFRLRPARDHEGSELPVAGIYLLDDGPEVQIEAVRALTAVAAIGRECFVRLQRANPEVLQAHLRDCTAVVAVTPVRRLTRPRDLARIEALVDMVLSDTVGAGRVSN